MGRKSLERAQIPSHCKARSLYRFVTVSAPSFINSFIDWLATSVRRLIEVLSFHSSNVSETWNFQVLALKFLLLLACELENQNWNVLFWAPPPCQFVASFLSNRFPAALPPRMTDCSLSYWPHSAVVRSIQHQAHAKCIKSYQICSYQINKSPAARRHI